MKPSRVVGAAVDSGYEKVAPDAVVTPNSRVGESEIHSVSVRPSPSTSMVGWCTAPVGIVAEFVPQPAPVATPVGVGIGSTVAVGVADGVLDSVDVGGAPVAVGADVGDGIRKHPLNNSAVLLAMTANRASGTSRCDMPQS
jgi:hypothetical protein